MMIPDERNDGDADQPTIEDSHDSPLPTAPSIYEVEQPKRFDKADFSQPAVNRAKVPKQIANYRLLNRVGQGGAGSVYRAQSLSDDSIVAIKILKPNIMSSPIAVQRFEKEARLQAEIDSPYVTRLHEFGCENGLHYIVSEFVHGVSLRKICPALSQSDKKYALLIIRDVLRALAAMHKVGVVHRDVKPENVLVTFETGTDFNAPDFERFQVAKLTDFGLARHIEQSESLAMTQQKAILGTPIYLSPEQYSESRAVDARADVYSLGATLFHLLAGEPPFNADSFLELADLHRAERPRPLNGMIDSVGDALSNVVAKALEKQPDMRYPNAQAMLTDIENVLAGRPISIPLIPEIPEITAGVRRFQFHYEFDVTAENLWPLISDTDRFNRAMGLQAPDYSFEERTDQTGSSSRTLWAEVRFNGMSMKWLENPFQWIEQRELSVLREFQTGPLVWFTNTVELFPLVNNRTRLVHSIQVMPRNLLGRMLTPIQFGWLTKRSLNKVYAKIARIAAERNNALVCDLPFGKAVTLTSQGRKRLDSKIKEIGQKTSLPTLADKLGQYLKTASDTAVSRIRPRPMAHSFAVDPHEFIALCLSATEQGVLSLMWDLICPVCRIAADTKDSIRTIANHAHCSACNSDFKVDFAKSVELIFRVHPEIRTTDTRTYCIGGPFHSSHVIAQTRLSPDQQLTIGSRMEEGSYQVRGPQLPAAQPFGVKATAPSSHCHFDLLTVVPQPELAAGQVAIELKNSSPQRLLARVERLADRIDATTAADVSRLPQFRQLFPSEVISTEQLVNVTRAFVLLIRTFGMETLISTSGEIATRAVRNSLLEFLTGKHRSLSIKSTAEEIQVVGELLESVLPVILAIQDWISTQTAEVQNLQFGFAISSGELLVGGGQASEFFGKTIRQVQTMIQPVQPQELRVTQQLASEPSFQQFAELHLQPLRSTEPLATSDGTICEQFTVRG